MFFIFLVSSWPSSESCLGVIRLSPPQVAGEGWGERKERREEGEMEEGDREETEERGEILTPPFKGEPRQIAKSDTAVHMNCPTVTSSTGLAGRAASSAGEERKGARQLV